MTWHQVAVCLGVYAITAVETLVATWESRADRQSTMAADDRFSRRSAHWATAFELVLFFDVIAITSEGWYVLAPILLGAWTSKYWSLETRRKKFRTTGLNRGKRTRPAPETAEEEDE